MTCTVIEVESKTKGFPQEKDKGETEVKNTSVDYSMKAQKVKRYCLIMMNCVMCVSVIWFIYALMTLPRSANWLCDRSSLKAIHAKCMIVSMTAAFPINVVNVYYHFPKRFTYSWKFWIYVPIVRVRYKTISF